MREITDAYKSMWNNYANFNGRTSVKGFWFAMLATAVVYMMLGIICTIVFFALIATGDSGATAGTIISVILLCAYSIAIIIPSISISIRRLHDAGFSGIMYLINLVPSVGQIAFIVLCCLPSTQDERYGSIDSQV